MLRFGMSSSVLDDVERIRKRPGMYLGDPRGDGAEHVVYELLSNSLDAHLAGDVKRIEVELHRDGAVVVRDDGPGISVAPTESGRPFLEQVCTWLHEGATADGHAPHLHLGSHCLGLCLVSAVAARLRVEVNDGTRAHLIVLERGRVVQPLTRIAATPRRGTSILFRPDHEIFAEHQARSERVMRRVEELSAFLPELEILLRVERTYGTEHDVLALLAGEYENPPWHEPVVGEMRRGLTHVLVAFAWGHGDGRIRSYCNFTETRSGGSHVRGFERGIRQVLGSEVPDGLCAIVSVTLVDPRYGSPTKDRLDTSEVAELVELTTAAALRRALEDDSRLHDLLPRIP